MTDAMGPRLAAALHRHRRLHGMRRHAGRRVTLMELMMAFEEALRDAAPPPPLLPRP